MIRPHTRPSDLQESWDEVSGMRRWRSWYPMLLRRWPWKEQKVSESVLSDTQGSCHRRTSRCARSLHLPLLAQTARSCSYKAPLTCTIERFSLLHVGCPVPRLWQLLVSSQHVVKSLTDPLKQAIWAEILQPGASIVLCHPPKLIKDG